VGRQPPVACHGAVVEARRVVGRHRALIVGIVVVHEPDALYGVAGLIQLPEDVEQVVGNELVAHQLAAMLTPILVDVQHPQVAQFVEAHGAVFL